MPELKPIIDISYWQRAIDYDQLAGAVSGVILRGAYGIWPDTWFEKHYSEFLRRGVPIGSYHYIIGNYPGEQQAELYHSIIWDKILRLGKWNDVEDRREATRLSKPVVVRYQTRLERLLGEPVDIYTGKYAWDEIIGEALFPGRKLWIANYGVTVPALPKTGGWSSWHFWQFTSKGRLPGYSSDLDLNNFNGSAEYFRSLYGSASTIPVVPGPGTPAQKYCSHCGAYSMDDHNGCCSACGAPRVEPGFEPVKMIVAEEVRIRTSPFVLSNNILARKRQPGEVVLVEDIQVNSSNSIWVRDREGWSAVVHSGYKYMD